MALLKKLRLSPWLLLLTAAGILLDDPLRLWLSLCCVLLHECGHCVMAYAFGARIEGITLSPVGGTAFLRGNEQLTGLQSLLIALSGPLVSTALAALCCFLAGILPLYAEPIRQLACINGLLCLFNLLPALPLDGGRALCALAQGKRTERMIQRLTVRIGILLGGFLIFLGILLPLLGQKLNLTLLLSGGAVAVGALREKKALPLESMRRVSGRIGLLNRSRVLPVCHFAVMEGVSREEVLRQLPAHSLCRVTWFDEGLNPLRTEWEWELLHD